MFMPPPNNTSVAARAECITNEEFKIVIGKQAEKAKKKGKRPSATNLQRSGNRLVARHPVRGRQAAQREQPHCLHALCMVHAQLGKIRAVAAVVGSVGVQRGVRKNVYKLKQPCVLRVFFKRPHLQH